MMTQTPNPRQLYAYHRGMLPKTSCSAWAPQPHVGQIGPGSFPGALGYAGEQRSEYTLPLTAAIGAVIGVLAAPAVGVGRVVGALGGAAMTSIAYYAYYGVGT